MQQSNKKRLEVTEERKKHAGGKVEEGENALHQRGREEEAMIVEREQQENLRMAYTGEFATVLDTDMFKLIFRTQVLGFPVYMQTT